MAFLLDPFRYEFFVRGLIAATVVGGLCGMIGTFVVLRRMSYIGHGLSHSVFGGAVVSYVMSWNFYLGAGLWGFLSAVLINWTARKRQIGGDAAGAGYPFCLASADLVVVSPSAYDPLHAPPGRHAVAVFQKGAHDAAGQLDGLGAVPADLEQTAALMLLRS